MVDDAHAVGVFGQRGEGLAARHPRIDVVLGTLGKAFGTAGAFVACSELVRSHLVNFCGGVIYSTAPPPAAVGAADAALRKIRSGELRQDDYLERVRDAHARLRDAGFETDPSDTQIVPIQLGDDRTAMACASHLASRGILAVPIRPPTVPEGTARLRVSLTRLHTAEHVDLLVDALVEAQDRVG
jgi:8-amino-7-oxononanoate synthase